MQRCLSCEEQPGTVFVFVFNLAPNRSVWVLMSDFVFYFLLQHDSSAITDTITLMLAAESTMHRQIPGTHPRFNITRLIPKPIIGEKREGPKGKKDRK